MSTMIQAPIVVAADADGVTVRAETEQHITWSLLREAASETGESGCPLAGPRLALAGCYGRILESARRLAPPVEIVTHEGCCHAAGERECQRETLDVDQVAEIRDRARRALVAARLPRHGGAR